MGIKTKYVGLESYQNIQFHFTSMVVGSEKENMASPGAHLETQCKEKNSTHAAVTINHSVSKVKVSVRRYRSRF